MSLIVAGFLIKTVNVFVTRNLEDTIDTTVWLLMPRVSSKVHDISLNFVEIEFAFDAPKRQADTSSAAMFEFKSTTRAVLEEEPKNDEGCMDVIDTFLSCWDASDEELMLLETPFSEAMCTDNPDLENRNPSKLISRDPGPGREKSGRAQETIPQPLWFPLHVKFPRWQ